MRGLSTLGLIALTALGVATTSVVGSYFASAAFFDALVDADVRRQVSQTRRDITREVGIFIVYSGVDAKNSRVRDRMRQLGVVGVTDVDGRVVFGSWFGLRPSSADTGNAYTVQEHDSGAYVTVSIALGSLGEPIVDYERRTFAKKTLNQSNVSELVGFAQVRFKEPASAAARIRNQHLLIGSSLIVGVLFFLALIVYMMIGRPLAAARRWVEVGDVIALRKLVDSDYCRVVEIGSLTQAYLGQYEKAHDTVSRLECMVNERTADLNRVVVRNRSLMVQATNKVDKEPRRIAAEIHDDLCSMQVALKRRIERYRKKIRNKQPRGTELDQIDNHLTGWIELTDEMDKVARGIIGRYRNDTVQYLGVEAALRDTVNRECVDSSSIQRIVVINRSAVLDDVEVHVQREIISIVKEAVRNTVKHTLATRVSVTVDESEEGLIVQITDDGGGFNLEKCSESFGLNIMEERAIYVGGQLTISRNGQGTRVMAVLPAVLRENSCGIANS